MIKWSGDGLTFWIELCVTAAVLNRGASMDLCRSPSTKAMSYMICHRLPAIVRVNFASKTNIIDRSYFLFCFKRWKISDSDY